LHAAAQIAIRCRDQAHVCRKRALLVAEAVHHPVLDDAQEAGLERRRTFADLVEEERAAGGDSCESRGSERLFNADER